MKLPSRLWTVWSGLALAFAVSVVMPVYGTGSNSETSTVENNAEQNPDVGTSPEANASADSQNEPSEAATESPELTLVEKLEARMKQLDKREQDLQDDEQRLAALRRDLQELAARQENAIAEAMAIRESQQSTGETDQSQKSLNHLIKVYEAMDPDEAALRISEMNEALALDILAGIKEKKAAGMLAGVEPAKAAKLSQGLRHYHKKKKSSTP